MLAMLFSCMRGCCRDQEGERNVALLVSQEVQTSYAQSSWVWVCVQ